MRKLALSDIKNKKNYYRDLYRKLIFIINVSTIISIILIIMSILIYITEPDPTFYATNSASNIMRIKSMNQPNYSSSPLLKPDLPMEMKSRTFNE